MPTRETLYTRSGEIHRSDPVPGQCCPACGEQERIVIETRRVDATATEIMGYMLLGLSLVSAILFSGETKRRCRCLNCDCLFHGVRPRWHWVVRTLLLLVLLGVLIYYAYASGMKIPTLAQVWAMILQVPLYPRLILGGLILTVAGVVLTITLYPTPKRGKPAGVRRPDMPDGNPPPAP